MKAYKRAWDVNNNKFCLVEFDVANPFDFSNDPDVNLVGEEKSHNCDFDIMQKSIDEDNKHIVSGFTEDYFQEQDNVVVRKCPDCGKFFALHGTEAKFFLDRELNLPKRCFLCRLKRRQR